jgi:hypothetical protein
MTAEERVTDIPWSKFGALLTRFRRTALRLEVRERYDTDLEREPQRKFLAGEVDDLAWAWAWLDLVRKATEEGREFRRVRIVSLPLSDYNRYALWFAEHTIEAGEDIRYLDRTHAVDLPDADYWLFDAEKPVKVHYDDADRPVKAEVITEPAAVEELVTNLELAFGRAVPREQFMKSHGLT